MSKNSKIEWTDHITKHVAELLEEIEARGKMQWAVHIHSRMKAVVVVGWLSSGWTKTQQMRPGERRS